MIFTLSFTRIYKVNMKYYSHISYCYIPMQYLLREKTIFYAAYWIFLLLFYYNNIYYLRAFYGSCYVNIQLKFKKKLDVGILYNSITFNLDKGILK